jgi:Domain of unknown function (DUF4263)
MKKFLTLEFDRITYERELNEFNQLLSQNQTLNERATILPFFKERILLSSRIASLLPEFFKIDKIAYEYDLFGDFTSDLVIGDAQNHTYCFVEFEDAMPNSVFTVKKSKYQPEFSTRFEHGYSQIVDWFYELTNIGTSKLKERFGKDTIDFHGVLIIGRNHFLNDVNLLSRLDWRSKNIIVNSKRIRIFTYDDLYQALYDKLYYA